MDRLFVLQHLTRCLSEAAAERNWEALTRVNGLVAAALPELAEHGAWSTLERSAVDELRSAHGEASEYCARELAYLSERLTDMQVRHSAWRAYAASGDLEEQSPS